MATILRVSTAADGTQGNSDSFTPVFSPDGGSIAFASSASNLVAGDTNNSLDVFVKDLSTGAITRVSTAADGAQRGSDAFGPVFSPDGGKIAFVDAVNLRFNDLRRDIFVKDLASGALTLVNATADGTRVGSFSVNPAFSSDGRSIAFQTDAKGPAGPFDIFVRDLVSGAITRVSTAADGTEGNSTSQLPAFSPAGGKIAFSSFATNFVAGDTNDAADIFVKDLGNGAITRVSTAADGAQADNSSFLSVFSPDGREIAFESGASNLVGNDTNGAQDIFVKDLASGAITRISVAADGAEANSGSFGPTFSPDGTKIAFASSASNLVAGDTNGATDLFVKDLASGAVTRAGIAVDGAGAFSPDGRKIVFSSDASNLVPGDTNGASDIFIATLDQPPTANADTYSTRKAKLLTVDAAHGVLANDTDIGSPTLTAELVGGPTHARSFALAADGSFRYRPVASFSGTDSFTYEADDGQSVSAPATVTIFVTSPRKPGPITPAAGSQGVFRTSAPPPGSATSLQSAVLSLQSAVFAPSVSEANLRSYRPEHRVRITARGGAVRDHHRRSSDSGRSRLGERPRHAYIAASVRRRLRRSRPGGRENGTRDLH
jgi:Tol biopolymer transport system component